MSNSSDKIPAESLLDYLAGEVTPEEGQRVAAILERSPSHAVLADALRDPAAGARFNPEIGLRMLESRLVVKAPIVQKHSRGNLSYWFKAIGGLAAVGFCVMLALQYLPIHTKPQIAVTNNYSTLPGQRASIILGDGTKVMLNVASKLSLSNNFNGADRVVYLEGAAQFDVTHNASKPFIVRANGTQVQDLATVFVVSAYNGSAKTQVAVREGKVSIRPSTLTNAAVVEANQIATVANNGIPVVKDAANLDNYFGWTTGKLVFRNTPLADALVQLSRWYGMEFRSADSSLLSLDLTGELPAGFDINKLYSIAGALEADVERSGNVVTFKPKKRL